MRQPRVSGFFVIKVVAILTQSRQFMTVRAAGLILAGFRLCVSGHWQHLFFYGSLARSEFVIASAVGGDCAPVSFLGCADSPCIDMCNVYVSVIPRSIQ
eukprot:scaffold72204_cov18-Tisochrysis_lutea.AAC.1